MGMYSGSDLQKLVQMLAFLGYSPSPVGWSGGSTASRPASPSPYQYYFDTDLGMPVFARQITPSVVWVDAAGVPV
jgi:hypothetical protein